MLFPLVLIKEKSPPFLPEPTLPFVRCPIIFFPQELQIHILSMTILCPTSLLIISAYFRVMVSIGTFY